VVEAVVEVVEGVRVYETLIMVATLDRVWMLETEREMDRVVRTGTIEGTSVNVTVGEAEGVAFVAADVRET